jgi:hypothetical protein
MAAYKASQKDAARLHAREATFVQTLGGPGALLHHAHYECISGIGNEEDWGQGWGRVA